MTCDPLPNTGLDAGIEFILLLALACLVVGATTMLAARRRARETPVALALALLLTLGSASALITVGTGAPARRPRPAGCSTSSSAKDRLTVTQTSTMVGLAPGVTPAPITGRIVNISDQSTPGSPPSTWRSPPSRPGAAHRRVTFTSRDYRLIAARMPVGRTLQPGKTTPFAGASIGFNNDTSNQDACQGAAVHLLYTANP